MKVYIGPYKNFINTYTVSEKILFFLDKNDDRIEKLCDILNCVPFLPNFLAYLNRPRKINVKIDKYDTWSLYSTLADIIYPALVEYKKRSTTYSNVDEYDLPFELQQANNQDGYKKWIWVVDEMIWAFSQINIDWEDQFVSGISDMSFVPSKEYPDHFELKTGPDHTIKIDFDARAKHQKRISNGLRLFGKYYQSLWD